MAEVIAAAGETAAAAATGGKAIDEEIRIPGVVAVVAVTALFQWLTGPGKVCMQKKMLNELNHSCVQCEREQQ